jgi:hypothetical protein
VLAALQAAPGLHLEVLQLLGDKIGELAVLPRIGEALARDLLHA